MTVRVFMPALDANTLPTVPAGFVHCIRLINDSDDSAPLAGAEVKLRVANLLPPGKLFSRDMMVLPVLHAELLEWLSYWRAEINMDDAPSAAMALASQLYEDDEHDLAIKLLMEDARGHTRKPTAPSPMGLVAGAAPGRHGRGFNPSSWYLGGTLGGDGTRRPDFMGMPSQDARLHQRSQERASQGGNLGMDIGGPGGVPLGASRSDHRKGRRDDPPGVSGGGRGGGAHGGFGGDQGSGAHGSGIGTAGQRLDGGGDALDRSDSSGGAGDGGSFHDDRSSHGYGTGHFGGAGPAHIQDNMAVSATESRQAREISGRFKDRAAKFTGRTDQLFTDYKTQYDLVTRDFGVSASQKMLLLQNLLDGEAMRFYLDEVMRTTVSYDTACAKIERRFLTAVHQGRAANYHQNLRMSDFIKEDVSEAEALEKVFTIIARVAKKLPREFSGDAHRAHFMRGAVIGYPEQLHADQGPTCSRTNGSR